MINPAEDGKAPELITDEEALAFMRRVASEWDMEQHDPAQNAFFLTHLAHWTLEAFGQENDRGEWFLHPAAPYGEGFPHSGLPDDLQAFVATERYGEIYGGQNNGVTMTSATTVLEEDPIVPKWEILRALATFEDMLRVAANDPEILAGIQPSRFIVIPGVHIKFQPATHFGWGLQFIAQETDVRVVPYGDYGRTQVAFQYATERRDDPLRVAQTTRDLILAAATHAHRHSRPAIPIDMTDTLHARLEGLSTIPLDRIECTSKPSNAMKNTLMEYLLRLKRPRQE